MKYIHSLYIGLLSLLFIGCTDEIENSGFGQGEGRLVLSGIKLEAVVGEVTTKAALEEDILPEITDFTIEIVDSEGSPIDTLEHGTLQTTLSAGIYTLKAIYGNAEVMSETPAFYGEKEVTIIANQNTETEIEASLAQAVIRPSIDADLEAQFKEYKLELSNSENQVAQLENNKDIFIPCNGTYTLTLSGTNQLGEPFTHTWNYEQEFAVRTRYIAICNPDLPSFTLPIQDITNAWGTFIYITPMTAESMTSHQEMADKVLANVVYEASSDGTTWIPSETTEDGKIIIKGLTPATPYTIRSRFGAVYSENKSQLTTENAEEVPNGDFEELIETINMTINQGGRWSITDPFWTPDFYQTTLSMNISDPSYWSSINQKTCNVNASNQNSWYMVPSTYNTSLRWLSHQPTAKIMGIGQDAYDSTADIYKNNSAKSGNNAMVVRNVAWDLNGPSISDHRQTGNTDFSNYFCKSTPSSIANRSVGKLFLGSYSYDNGAETYNEGISFTSRPCYLNGFYKYANDSQDTEEKGIISIQLLNGETVIASGKQEFVAVNEYTAFSVPLNYEQYNLQATILRIMISSSNHTDEANIKTTNYVNKDECCSRGAMLTIDNLTFSYEYNANNE